MSTSSGWIGVDLDGTLAHYVGWDGGRIGEPIEPMMARVRQWLAEGKTVKIFTARVATPCLHHESYRDRVEEARIQRAAIQDWLESHGLPRLDVTCAKDFAMYELWDDRCVQVRPNTGEPVDPERREPPLAARLAKELGIEPLTSLDA